MTTITVPSLESVTDAASSAITDIEDAEAALADVEADAEAAEEAVVAARDAVDAAHRALAAIKEQLVNLFAGEPDYSVPYVVSTSPAAQAAAVDPDGDFVFTYNEPVSEDSAVSSNFGFVHTQTGDLIRPQTCTRSVDGRQITITSDELIHGSAYQLRAERYVTDVDGNAVREGYLQPDPFYLSGS